MKKRNGSFPGGFGLVEVMVSAAIMAIIGLAMSNLFTNSLKVQRHLSQANTATGVEITLNQMLQNSTACSESLISIDLTKTTPQTFEMKDGSGNTVMAAGIEMEKLRIASLTATVLQSTGTVRLIQIQGKVEKLGPSTVRDSWTFDRMVNVSVAGGNVVSCLTKDGGLIRIEQLYGLLKPTGTNGYLITYGSGSPSAGTYSSANDNWSITDSRFYNNCPSTSPQRWLGCTQIEYPPITFTAEGSLVVIQAYSGVGVYHDSPTHTLSGTSGFEVDCGGSPIRLKAASLTTSANNALGVDGTSAPYSIPTTPDTVCTITPFVGWSWWAPGFSPITNAPNAQISAYAMTFAVSHYR